MNVDRQEMEQLLKDLIKQESVVNTSGELKIAENLFHYVSSLPYFQHRLDQVELNPTYHDNKKRYNVLAYVKGEAVSPSKETIILMSHMDTVGTGDYGAYKHEATRPDELKEVYKKIDVPAHIRQQAMSDDWMFGRGSVDMKSGIAAHLYVIKYLSEHTQELNGNVLLLITCDEEDSSHGIRSALKDLKRIKEKEGFRFISAINSDYTSARYTGDDNRYIYVGTVGKLLPTFFIAGKETHVGEVFEGFDPNLLISALTLEVDYNPLLCDEKFGEWTLPPVSLKQSDLKPFYDVQTPLAAFVYYNFFVHSWSPKDVLDKLKNHGHRAFTSAIQSYMDRYTIYCKLSGEPYHPLKLTPKVYTFAEYYDQLKAKHGKVFEEQVGFFCEWLIKEPNLDVRKFSTRVVEEIWDQWDDTQDPVMIIFYSSIYNPRIAISKQQLAGERLITAIESTVKQVQPLYSQKMKVKQFYPYISDMSYVALSDDEQSLAILEKNMPTWGARYKLNVEDIQVLNVPVCNIGPYGFDAHKKYERVELTYSLEIVPLLTYNVIRKLFSMT